MLTHAISVPQLLVAPYERRIMFRPRDQPNCPMSLLPPIPSSHIDWLASSSLSFWQHHQRCIAFVLLYSPQASRWSIQLPRQSCLPQAVEFVWNDLPEPISGGYLAGSYQLAPLTSDPDSITALAPAFCGLHFMQFIDPSDLRLALVLRLSDRSPQAAIPHDFVRNDKVVFLDAATKRLELI